MKILFVHANMSSFTRMDLDILRQVHEVRVVHLRRETIGGFLDSSLKTWAGVWWADLVFAWFGSFHALVAFLPAVLLGRRRVVVAGGYDVACDLDIEYGNMRPGVRRQIGRAVFRMAHLILPFSRNAAEETCRYAGADRALIHVIPLGVPTDWVNKPIPETKEKIVLTVGSVNRSNLIRKGFRAFVEAARLLPDISFVMIGEWEDDAIEDLRANSPVNVKFTGLVSDDKLLAWMQKARVYVQVSAHEGFGLALAEAMLCGCIPVVTARSSLPEVVGDTGLFVPYNDAQATAQAIRQALEMGPESAARAHRRIHEHFPLARRSEQLLQALRTFGPRESGTA